MTEFMRAVAGDITDPIRTHIIKHIFKLQTINKRLRDSSSKPHRWKALAVPEWKPFDLVYYFISKYEDRYKKSYRFPEAGKVAIYQKLEAFMSVNSLSNMEFKNLIDIAFTRYFNMVNHPRFEFLLGADTVRILLNRDVKDTTREDLLSLDEKLKRSNAEFERLIKEKYAEQDQQSVEDAE